MTSSWVKFYQPQNTNAFTGNKTKFKAVQIVPCLYSPQFQKISTKETTPSLLYLDKEEYSDPAMWGWADNCDWQDKIQYQMTNISSIFCPRCAEMTGQLWSILVLNIKSRIFNNILPQLRGDDRTIAINPRTTKINAHTTGFFLTQSSDEVKRCKYYNILFQKCWWS